jgi:hypothetical protein
MTTLISFPFRLSPMGYVVTRPNDSTEYYAEELGCLVGTVPGERPLVPHYGLTDPTYNAVDGNEIAIKVGLFGPPVRIVEVVPRWVSASKQDVVIKYEPIYQPTRL